MIKDNNTLIFNVTEHRNNFSGCDYNAFAAALEKEGATIAGVDTPNGVEMHISNMRLFESEEIANACGISDLSAYITDESSVDDIDVNDDYEESLDEYNEDALYFDEFTEDVDMDMFDDLDVNDFDEEYDGIEDTDVIYPSYEEISGETIEDMDDYSDDLEYMEDEDIIDDSELGYESELSMYDDVIDEAFKSKGNRKLNEKRKGCCPPKRRHKLNESYDDNDVSVIVTYDAVQNGIDDGAIKEIGFDHNKNVGIYDLEDAIYYFEGDIDLDEYYDDVMDELLSMNSALFTLMDADVLYQIVNGHDGFTAADASGLELYESRKSKGNRKLNEGRVEDTKMIQRIVANAKNSEITCVKVSNKYDYMKYNDLLSVIASNLVVVPASVMNIELFGDYVNLVYTLNRTRNTKYAQIQKFGGYTLSGINVILYLDCVERIPLKSKNALLMLLEDRQFELNGELIDLSDDIQIVCSYSDMDSLNEMGLTNYMSFINEPVIESRKSKGNLVSLTEALKSFENDVKDQKKLDKITASVDDVLKMVKGQTIGEREARDAYAKLKKEQNAIKKLKKNDKENFKLTDISGVKAAVKQMCKADPTNADKYEKLLESVVNALNSKRKSLYENALIHGKKLGTISYKELCDIYESVCNKKKALTSKLKTIDVSSTSGKELKESIAKKNKTIAVLNEELAYRQVAAKVFKKLNEEEEAKQKEDKASDDTPSMDDLAAMFGSGDMESDSKDAETKDDADTAETSDEETEEVELARIVIEMASKEDAEQLMSLCKDAGIPEDAMEIETADSDEAEEDTDEVSEDETEDDGAQNESIRYSNLRRLFEADENDADASDDGDTSDTEDDEAEEEEEIEEGSVKFVLTDSDYVTELAGVLADEYGITEEEFEGMIGGEIVETDDTDDEDSTEDVESKDDETEEDDIDASDIFGNM